MEQLSPILQKKLEQHQPVQAHSASLTNSRVDIAGAKLEQLDRDTVSSSFKDNKNDNNNAKNKLGKIAAIGSVAVAVVIACIALYKSRGTKLDKIKFKKGIAYLKNGDKYTGKIKDKLPNSDKKIVMEYADGVLIKSTVSSNSCFVKKVFKTSNNKKSVVITKDGRIDEFNFSKVHDDVVQAQQKLKTILQDETFSPDEIKKQTDAIPYKSKEQKTEIEKKIKQKIDDNNNNLIQKINQKNVSEGDIRTFLANGGELNSELIDSILESAPPDKKELLAKSITDCLHEEVQRMNEGFQETDKVVQQINELLQKINEEIRKINEVLKKS